jgi:hypothetical protein
MAVLSDAGGEVAQAVHDDLVDLGLEPLAEHQLADLHLLGAHRHLDRIEVLVLVLAQARRVDRAGELVGLGEIVLLFREVCIRRDGAGGGGQGEARGEKKARDTHALS